MKELKCPNCNQVFHVDQATFDSLAGQVRNAAFDEEVTRRLEELRRQMSSEFDVKNIKELNEFNERLNEKERALKERESEISLLRQKLDAAPEKTRLELADDLAAKDREIERLKTMLDGELSKKELEMVERLSGRDAEIARLKEQIQNSRSAEELNLAAERSKMENETARILADKDKEAMMALADKEKEIAELKSELSRGEELRKVAVLEEQKRSSDILREKEELISDLRNAVESEKKEAENNLNTLREQHALVMRQKDETIEYYKDLKARMSTKMVGESLEIHCHNLFLNAQSMGMFQDAYFDKDNDASSGSKGDFIFRDFINGNEYISIMFEMKNEADTTATKHKNLDFIDKLDKDRNTKRCEYAVLVSLLERDNELYNNGIVNMSHKYPKMYVIRPQMFMPLISILCQEGRKSARQITQLRQELELARAQSVDVTKFEKRRDKFVADFGKYVDAHNKKHNEAMGGIDKVIESLEKQIEQLRKVKTSFEGSQQKLIKANDAAVNDFTIKTLTRGNATMKKLFDEARNNAELLEPDFSEE